MSARVTLLRKPALGVETGIGRYAGCLASALAGAANYDVSVGTPPRLPPLAGRLGRAVGLDLDAFSASYPLSAGRDAAACDLLHLTSQTLASLLTLRRPRCPVVVTVHDIIPYVLRHDVRLSSYGSAAERLCDRLALAGLSRADALIADSEATRRDLVQQLGLAASLIEVVPLGVDATRFRAGAVDARFRQRYELPAGPAYVLYVGSEAPHKNLEGLLRVFADVRRRCPAAVLLKVGGVSGDRPRLRSRAADLGLAGALRFVDNVPDADLPAFYNLASVCVTASLYEGFGLPALEALASATPIVCYAATSLPEIVGDAGVLVPPDDEAALANAIVALLQDEARRDDLARRGVKQAQSFSWASTAHRTAAVYDRLLGRSLAPAFAGAAATAGNPERVD